MKCLFLAILVIFFGAFLAPLSFAIENPLIMLNNKVGVHILFTQELDAAGRLVNTSNGDWGYVTIPIQAGDRNLEKWQKFMDDCRKLHLTPIIRLATEGDYFNTAVWRKPTEVDVLDFANFLNSLQWPVKNRYVVVFNEVNRGDEWEGNPNPQEYARILNYAADVFKLANEDFFIISAGLDNASINIKNKSFNQYDFMVQTDRTIPGIFGKIDGLGSHSYPNPAFSKPPWITTNDSVSSFKYERDLALRLSGKKLPVFITETGWSDNRLSKNQISSYFTYAFESVWSDPGVAAVTTFLLQAGTEPYLQFSLLDGNGNLNEISDTIQKLPKIAGKPTVNYNTELSSISQQDKNTPLKAFPKKIQYGNPAYEKVNGVAVFLKWILKLPPDL